MTAAFPSARLRCLLGHAATAILTLAGTDSCHISLPSHLARHFASILALVEKYAVRD